MLKDNLGILVMLYKQSITKLRKPIKSINKTNLPKFYIFINIFYILFKKIQKYYPLKGLYQSAK